MLGNSIVMSVLMTTLQLCTSLLAAYALTRWDFKGKKLIYGLLSLCWLIPVQAIMIPNYVTLVNMGTEGNRCWELWLPDLAVHKPLSLNSAIHLSGFCKPFQDALD